MLGYATGLDMAGLLRCLIWRSDRPAPGFDGMVERRAAREPLALIILGSKAFWNFEVAVIPGNADPKGRFGER